VNRSNRYRIGSLLRLLLIAGIAAGVALVLAWPAPHVFA